MKPLRLAVLFVLPLAMFACTAEVGPDKQPPAQPAGNDEPAAQGAEAVVHDVKCGCSIEGVGRCGNYIMIDGRYVPLVHPSLGKMEFCAQKDAGAKIETVGAMQDGTFVAASWKLVE